VSTGSGTALDKITAFENAGIVVAKSPEDIVVQVKKII
jgi:succinyl-CoA synthetase alpha subunit